MHHRICQTFLWQWSRPGRCFPSRVLCCLLPLAWESRRGEPPPCCLQAGADFPACRFSAGASRRSTVKDLIRLLDVFASDGGWRGLLSSVAASVYAPRVLVQRVALCASPKATRGGRHRFPVRFGLLASPCALAARRSRASVSPACLCINGMKAHQMGVYASARSAPLEVHQARNSGLPLNSKAAPRLTRRPKLSE